MIHEEVAIVKMDATANDVPPGFDVRGFPTLYWLPKGGKDKPVRYEVGKRWTWNTPLGRSYSPLSLVIYRVAEIWTISSNTSPRNPLTN